MTPLPIPVPPILDAALGIPPASGRLVGLRWEPTVDDLVWHDGRSAGSGHGWAFLLFVRHPMVTPTLVGYRIGSSDRDADHWLLLDRTARTLGIAETAEARQLLGRQWPRVELAQPTELDITDLVARLAAHPAPTADAVAAAIIEQRHRERQLAQWLHRCSTVHHKRA